MYFVYVVHNTSANKYYIGQTQNLEERVRMHNDKSFKTCYTARFNGSWKLVYKEELGTRQEALVREKQLKSYRGREFVKSLIRKLVQK